MPAPRYFYQCLHGRNVPCFYNPRGALEVNRLAARCSLTGSSLAAPFDWLTAWLSDARKSTRVEPPAGGHLDGGRHAQGHAAQMMCYWMRYKCSSSVAAAKLSTAYLEEAKRNHHMRRPPRTSSRARDAFRSLLDLKRTKVSDEP